MLTRTEIVTQWDYERTFRENLNQAIREIEQAGGAIRDVQYQMSVAETSQVLYSALVVYTPSIEFGRMRPR